MRGGAGEGGGSAAAGLGGRRAVRPAERAARCSPIPSGGLRLHGGPRPPGTFPLTAGRCQRRYRGGSPAVTLPACLTLTALYYVTFFFFFFSHSSLFGVFCTERSVLSPRELWICTGEVEIKMMLEIRTGHNKAGCEVVSSRLPFPAKVRPSSLSVGPFQSGV